MFKHLVPLLLVSSNAFAAAPVICQVATNPETMIATLVPEKGDRSTEKVKSASLRIGDEYGQDSVLLKVVTESGKVGEAYAFNNLSGGYSVECDGGRLNLQAVPNSGGTSIISSEGVRLDQIGCDGEIYVETKSTTFVNGECSAEQSAPATN